MESKYPNAEKDSEDTFNFKPEGVLRLRLDEEPHQAQKGWTVHPKRDPMEVCAC